MIRITIVAVGKLKESYWKAAINEYSKRISRYATMDVIEIKEEPCPDNPSDAIIEKVKLKEGERILSKTKKESYVIVMDLSGEELESLSFADKLEKEIVRGNSHYTFIIGGSFGLSRNVVKSGNLILSLSEMTFPHQLARVILVEQIYRAMKINSGEQYHK